MEGGLIRVFIRSNQVSTPVHHKENDNYFSPNRNSIFDLGPICTSITKKEVRS